VATAPQNVVRPVTVGYLGFVTRERTDRIGFGSSLIMLIRRQRSRVRRLKTPFDVDVGITFPPLRNARGVDASAE
jgi:hypothetical protein